MGQSNNLHFIVDEIHRGRYLTMDGQFIRSNIEGNITPYKLSLLEDKTIDKSRVLTFVIHKEKTNEAYISSLTLHEDSAYRTSYSLKIHTDEMNVKCEYIHFGLGNYDIPKQFDEKIKRARLKKYNK